MYIEDDLIFYDVPVTNQNELFDFMADQLLDKRYVKAGFREAIKKREKQYPTGLELDGLNIAITHTEKEYAKEQKLVVIKPKTSITFQSIENLNFIEVDLIFGIVLSNSNGHLEILQKLSSLFQEKEIIDEMNNIESKEMLSNLMQQYFN